MKTETTKKCLLCQSEFSTEKKSILCLPCEAKAREATKHIHSFVENIASALETEIKKVTVNLGNITHKSESEKTKRCEDFWIFAHAALWPKQNFNKQAQAQVKSRIAELFNDKQAHDQTFLKLVESSIIDHLFFGCSEVDLVFSPLSWLSRNSPVDLSRLDSQSSIQKNEVNKIAMGAKLFAFEILNYSQTNDLVRLSAFRNNLIEQQQYALLSLYYKVVFHFQLKPTLYHF